MTIVSGIRSGLRSGLRSGINPGAGAGVAWTVDATSNIAVPADSTEWDDFIAAESLSVATPSSLWLCQEASGNLADSIGAVTLTAGGTCNYEQAVAGWSRKAVAGNDGVAADRFAAGSGVGPDPALTSQTWLWFVSFPANPGADRAVAGINFSNGLNNCRALHRSTGVPRINAGGANADGASSVSSGIHPLVIKLDRTNMAAALFTADEKVAGTFGVIVDGNKGIGNGTGARFLYGCMWSGANGEISDADIKALLEAMGWTIAWSA